MAEPTVETSIWMALKARVQSLVTVPVLPIDWPKQGFEHPTSGGVLQPYLEVRHLPNQSERLFLSGSDPERRMGILQLSVMYPVSLDHVGEVDIQLAGTIAAHFPADLKMRFGGVTVLIEKAPDVGQGMRDGAQQGYWRTPISIRWRAFA